MSDWANSDMTEVEEVDNRPIMGTTGGRRAARGDAYTLAFLDDGETVETQNGERVAFDARLVDATFNPTDGDGDVIDDDNTDVRFMTGSSRLLAELSEHDPLGGKVVEISVDGTGYDAAYTATVVDDE